VLAATGMRAPTKAACVLAVGWGLLVLATPFYQPYARLLLPLQAVAWVLMGGAFMILHRVSERLVEMDPRRVWGLPETLLRFTSACWLVPLILAVLPRGGAADRPIWELLGPSDSLRQACGSIASDLPEEVETLRLYARPPVTFYLSGKISVAPQPALD